MFDGDIGDGMDPQLRRHVGEKVKLVRFSGWFSTWSVFFDVFQQTKVGNKTQKQNKHDLSFSLHQKLSKSVC